MEGLPYLQGYHHGPRVYQNKKWGSEDGSHLFLLCKLLPSPSSFYGGLLLLCPRRSLTYPSAVRGRRLNRDLRHQHAFNKRMSLPAWADGQHLDGAITTKSSPAQCFSHIHAHHRLPSHRPRGQVHLASSSPSTNYRCRRSKEAICSWPASTCSIEPLIITRASLEETVWSLQER